MRPFVLMLTAAALVVGCSHNQSQSAGGDVMRIPRDATYIPRGVMLNARLETALGVNTSRVGDRFTARLMQPVLAGTGQILLPRDAVLSGHVTGLVAPTPTTPGSITIDLAEINYVGRVRPLVGEITEVSPSESINPKNVIVQPVQGIVLGNGDSGTIISLGGAEAGGRLAAGSSFWFKLKQGIIP